MASIISAGTSAGAAISMTGDTSGVLQLATNGSTTALTIDTSQNVGIGTNSPSSRLDVVGSAGALTNGIIRSLDGNMSRLTLSNTNRNWTISNYGTQFAPNGSLNIADETGAAVVFRIDTSANTYINSGYGSLAITYGCRAWVNFNGTGTVAIRASGNVSSITDNGVGNYTVNFTNGMPDVNYSLSGTCGVDGAAESVGKITPAQNVSAFATGSIRIICSGNTTTLYDSSVVGVSIFR